MRLGHLEMATMGPDTNDCDLRSQHSVVTARAVFVRKLSYDGIPALAVVGSGRTDHMAAAATSTVSVSRLTS